MVEYEEIKLDNNCRYIITKGKGFEGSDSRYVWTINNLDKMLREGRSISIINPIRSLDLDELEEYRRYFCYYAKKVKRNMVYFQGPVVIKKLDLT